MMLLTNIILKIKKSFEKDIVLSNYKCQYVAWYDNNNELIVLRGMVIGKKIL